MDHKQLVNKCLEWLAIQGIFAWENRTGAVKYEGRFLRYGKVGSGDIIGVLPNGTHFEAEIKVGKDRQKPEQKIHQMMIERNNGIYILARSIDDLQILIKK